MKKIHSKKKQDYKELRNIVSPAENINASDRKGVLKGMALCLSGGGYRAMLFHVGALWRINEAKLLPKLHRISSVSGGSIIAGVLGLNWDKLDFDKKGFGREFKKYVVEPIRALADITIDSSSVIKGMVMPDVTISDELALAYRRHLFGNATLQNFPNRPRFVINATNVQSGALWRFMKPYMRDWRVGKIKTPDVPLAVAIAASSAFPPMLSPMVLNFDESCYTPNSGYDLQCPPFTTRVMLTDGGVYDNLGLETVWKRYKTILVSDGGGQMQPEADPCRDWVRHYIRITNVIDNQVRNLRKQQVVNSYKNHTRNGAYWGIRSDISHYDLKSSLNCPVKKTIKLADIPTHLAQLDSVTQERLINWGYAVCDTALRKHVNQKLPQPDGFKYPKAKV